MDLRPVPHPKAPVADFPAASDVMTILGVGPNSKVTFGHPSTVSLLYDDGFKGHVSFCSGTLIASDVVLTAAHCFCHAGCEEIRGGRFYPTASACRKGRYRHAGEARGMLDTP